MVEPGRPLILVVEDEPLQLIATCDVAEDAGYEPLMAGDAETAWSMIEHRRDIDVVLSDVDLPGSDGLSLVKAIHECWPSISLILVSGHHRPDPSQLPEGTLFLAKPFNPVALTATLIKMRLDRP